MRDFLHKRRTYITEDERKLNKNDIHQNTQDFGNLIYKKYFDFIVNRLFPNKWPFLAKIDQFLLMVLKPLAPLLGGRICWLAI